jgi:hypothetical protein
LIPVLILPMLQIKRSRSYQISGRVSGREIPVTYIERIQTKGVPRRLKVFVSVVLDDPRKFFVHFLNFTGFSCIESTGVRSTYMHVLYVPLIPQQIQISVDQPYAGPASSCCVISGTHSIYYYYSTESTEMRDFTC